MSIVGISLDYICLSEKQVSFCSSGDDQLLGLVFFGAGAKQLWFRIWACKRSLRSFLGYPPFYFCGPLSQIIDVTINSFRVTLMLSFAFLSHHGTIWLASWSLIHLLHTIHRRATWTSIYSVARWRIFLSLGVEVIGQHVISILTSPKHSCWAPIPSTNPHVGQCGSDKLFSISVEAFGLVSESYATTANISWWQSCSICSVTKIIQINAPKLPLLSPVRTQPPFTKEPLITASPCAQN